MSVPTEFQVPPGTADEAKAQPTLVDAIAEDAKAADEPPDYPEGAPEFYALMRVPYRQRAEAIRKYGEVQAYLKAHPGVGQDRDEDDSDNSESSETDWVATADKFELVGLLDEFLLTVAVDRGAYEAWPERTDVGVFMQTWSAWQGRTQPGEASSSSS
jgi:hypothetical protein